MQTSKPANVRGHECRYIECADHSIWFRCLLRSYQSLHRVEHANWFLPLSHVLFLGRVFKSINFTESCQISFNRKHQLLCEQIAISDSQEQMSLSSTFLVSIVPFKKTNKWFYQYYIESCIYANNNIQDEKKVFKIGVRIVQLATVKCGGSGSCTFITLSLWVFIFCTVQVLTQLRITTILHRHWPTCVVAVVNREVPSLSPILTKSNSGYSTSSTCRVRYNALP